MKSMAKITSRYQVTVPKKIAEEYQIRPGDEIDWVPAGDAIRVIPGKRPAPENYASRLRWFDQATERQKKHRSTRPTERAPDRGWRRGDLYERGRRSRKSPSRFSDVASSTTRCAYPTRRSLSLSQQLHARFEATCSSDSLMLWREVEEFLKLACQNFLRRTSSMIGYMAQSAW
jgi:AbrB family looped-hinge helix DNA binding protein